MALYKIKSLYYPGSGMDFSTIGYYTENSSIKTFYYCDYLNDQLRPQSILDELRRQLPNYKINQIADIKPSYFNKSCWEEFWCEESDGQTFTGRKENSFIALYRLEAFDKIWELYYFGTEAIETYRVLLQNKIKIDLVVTQDHGLGCLWTTFCEGSYLEAIAQFMNEMPKYLLVGTNHDPWKGYKQISKPFGVFGVHEHQRIMYEIESRSVDYFEFKEKYKWLYRRDLTNEKEQQLTEMVLQTTELPAYLFSNKNRIINLPDQFIVLMSVKYKDERFKQFEVIDEFFKTFPDWESSPIQRGHVINLFKQNKKYLGFISAMIWGGINASRPKEKGNFETTDLYRLLSIKRSKIENIIEYVEKFLVKGEIKECFLFLKKEGKIDGIDYPYFTKLMYFIGQANDNIKIKPLIFDKWTSNGYMALLINSNNHTKLNEFYSGKIDKKHNQVRLRSQVQNAYYNFVLDMEKWASQIGINPSKLEEFIFGVSLKIDKTDSNPRNELWDIICKYDESKLL